jgi:hypothetical protein
MGIAEIREFLRPLAVVYSRGHQNGGRTISHFTKHIEKSSDRSLFYLEGRDLNPDRQIQSPKKSLSPATLYSLSCLQPAAFIDDIFATSQPCYTHADRRLRHGSFRSIGLMRQGSTDSGSARPRHAGTSLIFSASLLVSSI